MEELEKISKLITELKVIVSKIDFDTKKSLVAKNKNLQDILFESTKFYYNFSDEAKLFEKKFNVILSEKLKSVIGIFRTKGYSHSELFNHRISYHPIECFFSLEFVKILINFRISKSDIEDGYFDHETQKFNKIAIEEVYNQIPQKDNLLIYCISFAECCGGRNLLILNGDDENIVGFDNHGGEKEYIDNGEIYSYTTYLLHEKSQTIFDMISDDIIMIKEKIEPSINIY
ncbi:hypothetical protein L1S34_14435 [Flavobacterium sp. K77]|uniref:hypothetical protein n=1 Tax=Flavobacterium sp. K77 TaxID=2910676 RepID=UPI001F3CF62A|nr:hypothetical protein [Flavobacterium sp. K77]MCF6142490.1 hypothetical protein [Flavobacterium sp. K77]